MTFRVINPPVYKTYETICNGLIDDPKIGRVCVVIFPSEPSPLNYPSPDLQGVNSNFGPNGELLPFDVNEGRSLQNVETRDSIRVRYYPDPKVWTKYGNVSISEADLMIIGYIRDLEKVKRAKELEFTTGAVVNKYILARNPNSWGFGEIYFQAFLKRA